MIDRRSFVAAAAAAFITTRLNAQGIIGHKPSPAIMDLARSSALPMSLSGNDPSGPGWDFLRHEAAAAHTLLIGEEHGTSDVAVLARALFDERRKFGFD